MIKAILLAATVPFMTQHRNVLPKTEISTNFYGSVTGIVDQAYIEAHGGGCGGITTNNVEDIAYEVSTNVVTNVVTKTYVEGLGISAGLSTNDVNSLISSSTNNLRRVTDMAVYAEGVRPEGPWTWSSADTNLLSAIISLGNIPTWKNRWGEYRWGLDEDPTGFVYYDGSKNETTNSVLMQFRSVEEGYYAYATATRPRVFGPTADRLATTNQLPLAAVQTNEHGGVTIKMDAYGSWKWTMTPGDDPWYKEEAVAVYGSSDEYDSTYGTIVAKGGRHDGGKIIVENADEEWGEGGRPAQLILGSATLTGGSSGTVATTSQIPSTNGFVTASAATNAAEAVVERDVRSWARSETKPSYTVSEITDAASKQYVTDANSNTVAIVQTWEGFLDGSNVVFSITNYVSDSYNLNTAKLRIMEMTNGVYREVYNSRDEIVMHIDNFRTNDFRVATNSVITSVDTKIAGKADKAWGKYTSTGTEIAGIGYSNTVYMTEPTTVFAGGMEYARFAVGEGSICVLTTKGAPVYTTGDEGTFKFQDNGGTNYFGFAKTDSYTIGANASGISVQNQIVTITYDVSMSGVPCIWYIGSLENYDPTAWEQLNTPDGQPIAGASHIVQWEQNPPEGKRICYINCPEPKGFFKATIEVAGDAKFVTNMPADLAGGIIATNQTLNIMQKVEPYISNDQVLWRVKP